MFWGSVAVRIYVRGKHDPEAFHHRISRGQPAWSPRAHLESTASVEAKKLS